MTTTPTVNPLQYPIGKFAIPDVYTPEAIQEWIQDIKALPAQIHEATNGLTDEQLDTPYRPEGWTLRQVVHHLADSHMNALIRFKWTLTEDAPTIKAYDEKGWALQADYKLPIAPSLPMLEGIHLHMVALFESFTNEQWDLYFIHPQTGKDMTLKRTLATYAWHGKHHLAHITNTIATF
ncbi:YfiT family bacillithiol transferase [Mucilaginibacter antarcticus]|uniref:YfiT family bacillithiol transferase n=1 Tax=Mucilaginibacter antarcticus TaxID=1855725 RepID=A0ABW5XMG2_9SPHI